MPWKQQFIQRVKHAGPSCPHLCKGRNQSSRPSLLNTSLNYSFLPGSCAPLYKENPKARRELQRRASGKPNKGLNSPLFSSPDPCGQYQCTQSWFLQSFISWSRQGWRIAGDLTDVASEACGVRGTGQHVMKSRIWTYFINWEFILQKAAIPTPGCMGGILAGPREKHHLQLQLINKLWK